MATEFNLDNTTKLINISGRQRMLSQRIAFLIAARFKGFKGPFHKTIELFEESQRLLIDGNNEFPAAEQHELLKEYFWGQTRAHDRICDYVKRSKNMYKLGEGNLQEFFQFASDEIVPLLNEAVTIYQQIMDQKSREVAEELESKNRNIGKILKDISNVAQQVKFISFNTSILAAQANEAGKEFNIVSDSMQELTHHINRLVAKGLDALDLPAIDNLDEEADETKNESIAETPPEADL